MAGRCSSACRCRWTVHRARVHRDLMGQQWMELQQWVFPQRFFREKPEARRGRRGRARQRHRAGDFERTGASVMGKRMFEAGEQMVAGGGAVPQRRSRRDASRSVTPGAAGGTTFHFVNDGNEPALEPGPRGRRRPGRPHRGRRRNDPGVRERRPDRRVSRSRSHPCCSAPESAYSRAWTRAAWPGAGPCGADAAGDTDLRQYWVAVTVSTSPLPQVLTIPRQTRTRDVRSVRRVVATGCGHAILGQ